MVNCKVCIKKTHKETVTECPEKSPAPCPSRDAGGAGKEDAASNRTGWKRTKRGAKGAPRKAEVRG